MVRPAKGCTDKCTVYGCNISSLLERSRPTNSSSNPNGYTPRTCITNDEGEEETINSVDKYIYRHDIIGAGAVQISKEVLQVLVGLYVTDRG